MVEEDEQAGLEEGRGEVEGSTELREGLWTASHEVTAYLLQERRGGVGFRV